MGSVSRIFHYLFYPWIHVLADPRGYCLQAAPWHSFPCLPPTSVPSVWLFVFLAICSHCPALPDGRHSRRLGSVNCKGMWHSVLKLRKFLGFLGSTAANFNNITIILSIMTWMDNVFYHLYEEDTFFSRDWHRYAQFWTSYESVFNFFTFHCYLM